MKFTRIKTENSPRNVIRLPRLGKIRLGIKKVSASGKEYPSECSYFVCPPEVKRVFGEEPKALPVMLPVESEDLFFREYYAVYGANQKLLCQGDGERAERRIKPATDKDKAKIESMACPSPEACAFAQEHGCAARTDIMLIIPDISVGGCYQLSTGSTTSSIDIKSGLEMARLLYGRVSWVPMMLVREERKIPNPKTGAMNTHYPCRIYPVASIDQVNQIRQDSQRIFALQEQFALPEPVIEGEFTREAPDVDQAPPFEDTNDVAAFVRMIELAESNIEIENLFKSNHAAINALNSKDKVKVMKAKTQRESELTRAA